MDVSLKSGLGMSWAELGILLQYVHDPVIHKTFAQYGNKWSLLGGPLAVNTAPFEAKGLVRKFQLYPADNAVNLGVTVGTTPVPTTWSLPGWTNLRIGVQHMNTIECTVVLDRHVEQMIKRGDGGVAQASVFLSKQAVEGKMFKLDMLSILDRRAIISTLADDPGAPTDDETNNRYILTLPLSAKTFMPGLLKGRLLQAAAVPVGHAGITTLRNFAAPMVVIGPPEMGYDENTDSWFRVKVAVPYVTGTKTAIGNQLAAIIATDVITPWGGVTATNTTMPTGGPNYGLLGLRHWTETDGSGVFANVETAGGGIAAGSPLQTDEDNPRTVSRNTVAGEWDFLNPIVQEGDGAAVGTCLGKIENIAMTLYARTGEPVAPVVIAHPLVVKAMAEAAGERAINFQASATDAASKLFAKFGLADGLAIHSTMLARPILVGQHLAVPADMVLVIRGGTEPLFEYLAPEAPSWLPGTIGGIWSQSYNTSGQRIHQMEGTRQQILQMFPTVRLDDRLGILRGIVPLAAEPNGG